MANIDQLLQRNRDLAASGAHEVASIIGRHPVYVITCLDPRTDPSAFPGLEPGDAMVARNAGGRVPAGVLEDLAYIGYLTRTLAPGGPRSEVAVVHHTECGTRFPADQEFRRGFADLIGGDDAALARQAVTDPGQTVRPTSSSCARPPSCRTRSLPVATSTTSPPAWSPPSSPPRPCTPAYPASPRSEQQHLPLTQQHDRRARTAPAIA